MIKIQPLKAAFTVKRKCILGRNDYDKCVVCEVNNYAVLKEPWQGAEL